MSKYTIQLPDCEYESCNLFIKRSDGPGHCETVWAGTIEELAKDLTLRPQRPSTTQEEPEQSVESRTVKQAFEWARNSRRPAQEYDDRIVRRHTCSVCGGHGDGDATTCMVPHGWITRPKTMCLECVIAIRQSARRRPGFGDSTQESTTQVEP